MWSSGSFCCGSCRKSGLGCGEEPLLQDQADLCVSPGFDLLIVVNSEEVVELLWFFVFPFLRREKWRFGDHTCKVRNTSLTDRSYSCYCKRSKVRAGTRPVPDGCGSGVSKFAHGVFGAGGAQGEVTPEEGCRARRQWMEGWNWAPLCARKWVRAGWAGFLPKDGVLRLQLSTHVKSLLGDGCRADGWLLFFSSSGVLCVSGVPLLSKSDSHLFIGFASPFPSGRRLLIHLLPF